MKTCTKCEMEKEDSAFATKRGKLNSRCRQCVSAYYKAHYKKPERQRAQIANVNKLKWQKREESMMEVTILKSRPCADCKKCYDPVCMDFDYLPEFKKNYAVSYMVQNGYKLATILKEIAKCELVCSNCHRLRTKNRKPGNDVVVTCE